MGYSPENNPYIPGDPYSYDLKWMVDKMKQWTDPLDSADRAKASEEAAKASEQQSEAWAVGTIDGEAVPVDTPQHDNNSKYWSDEASVSAAEAKNYADHIADPVSGLVADWLNDHITQPTTPAIDTSLTVAGAAADAKAVGDRFDTFIEQDLESITTDFTSLATPMTDVAGYAITATRGGYSANTGTTSVIIDITKYTEFYLSPAASVPYVSAVVIENPDRNWQTSGGYTYCDGDSAVRYRKSDNNLPDENSPYTTSNAIVIITVTSNQDCPVTITSDEGVKLVKTAIQRGLGKPAIQYAPVNRNDFPESYWKEQINIFLPATIGFIQLSFMRNEYDPYNANNWRLDKAFAASPTKEKLFPIVNSGEWEMALQIDGRSDFIGGIAHGDEVLDNISFLLDGNKINDITALTAITDFDELKIIETTRLYDPADGATLSTVGLFTPIAEHGREYTFNSNGIKLRQYVKWLTAETLTASYMTMFPIIRGADGVWPTQITDTYYGDNNYVEYDVSVISTGPAWAWRKDVTRSTIWSDVSGISAEVVMIEQPGLNNAGADQFKVQDSAAYNKMYWSVCGVGGALYTTAVDERFTTETLYKINRCK